MEQLRRTFSDFGLTAPGLFLSKEYSPLSTIIKLPKRVIASGYSKIMPGKALLLARLHPWIKSLLNPTLTGSLIVLVIR